MTDTDIINGLSPEEAAKRAAEGRVNGSGEIKTKSIAQIVRDNTLTFFNFLNIVLAVLVLIFGDIKNAMFIGVIFCNTGIGIFQEIRAKRTIDRLTLISAPKAHVIRGGTEIEIPNPDIVEGDLVVFRAGVQASADCEIVSGECEVNESLITGESDPIYKKAGDKILSGSFAVSGECRAVAVGLGADSFANKITSGAKYVKKTDSKMMKAINTILKGISICIIPIMLLLMYNGVFVSGQSVNRAVVSTVAAIIGMIPEGLVLLTSIVLAVSSIRLAQNKTLVQDMYCIETLARVDVLCLDKTGTITEGSMQVSEVKLLDESADADTAMTALATALSDTNPTFMAVKERWNGSSAHTADMTVPFSSARKWSGAHFPDLGTYVMGAGEFILGDKYNEIKQTVEEFSAGGRRVILLAHADGNFADKTTLPENIKPLALIAIFDKIRAEAPATLKYFAEQGVDIKIISGDNPVTVSCVSRKAGVKNADRYIDASTVEHIGDVVDDYTIFGRVTPPQKLELVKALQAKGHTVGMTGDGVNDVLALKEADCSIAMQSGSEAARNVSNLVLLDSNFASMPKVVAEGRRSINNVERSASLFLSKTTYSLLLAVLFVIIQLPFLFEPIQMTLINALCIGAPSFLLALQPNKELIRGSFISNVLKRSIPNGISAVLALSAGIICGQYFGFTTEQLSTVSAFILAAVSFLIVLLACHPMRWWKAGMLVVLIGTFICGHVFFEGFFGFVPFTYEMFAVTLIITAAAALFTVIFNHTVVNITDIIRRREKVGPYVTAVLLKIVPGIIAAVIAITASVIWGNSAGLMRAELAAVVGYAVAGAAFLMIILLSSPMKLVKTGSVVLVMILFIWGSMFTLHFMGSTLFEGDVIAIITGVVIGTGILTFIIRFAGVRIAKAIAWSHKNR
ncbi:MAG: cation-translocating P-type ATPase [Ruminiclostridium sp.]|nr:cation-translocating P-type ATPase [Ruminiclostridium sp.]